MAEDNRRIEIREGWAYDETTVSQLIERLRGFQKMPDIWIVTPEPLSQESIETHVARHPLFRAACKHLTGRGVSPPLSREGGMPPVLHPVESTIQVPQAAPSQSSRAPSAGAASAVSGAEIVAPQRPVATGGVKGPFPSSAPDGYEFLDVLGHGAQGAVYKVLHKKLKQVRAMKVLVEHQASTEAAGFLKKEIEALRSLDHRNIVRIFDADPTSEQPFIIMEYVEGSTLRQILDERETLPLMDAIAVIRQVLEAIEHAHDKAVIHRDLKPGNIMVNNTTAELQVRVVDFGIARILRPNAELSTTQNKSLGTPMYRAPELNRSGREASRQSDLFSIGVILYEMLVGSVPQYRSEPLRAVKPEVDARVSALVKKLTEPKPANRPATASEVLKVLREVEASLSKPDKKTAKPQPGVGTQGALPKRSTVGFEQELVLTSQKNLPEHFRRMTVLPARYAEFMEFVAEKKKDLTARTGLNLLERTAITLEEFKESYALRIDGAPGTGKTAFLAALYWHLQGKRKNNPQAPLPLYLDMALYDARTYKGPPKTHLGQACALLKRDLASLAAITERQPNQKFIVILDHFDEHGRFRDELILQARSMLRLDKRLTLVIGSRMAQRKDGSYSTSVGLISCKSIYTQSSRFNSFVRLYAEAHGLNPEEIIPYVEQKVRKFRLSEVDCRMLWMIVSARRQSPPPTSLSELYDWECKHFLTTNGVPGKLEYPAELAFRYCIAGEDIPADEIDAHPVAWRMLHELHPTTRDFLVASHIVTTLMQVPQGNGLSPSGIKVLSYVYPWSITRFCRELAVRSVDQQRRILTAARKIFEGKPSYEHALVCLLLGRISNADLQKSARQFLEKQKEALESIQDLDSTIRKLIELTISISLIVLGPRTYPEAPNSKIQDPRWKAAQRYIEKLIKDPELDMLNRMFQLEYYGDVGLTATQQFIIVDELKECPRAFEKLCERIEGAIGNKDYPPLFELEVYTLCSLAQHRHEAGRLGISERERIQELADRIIRTIEKAHDLTLAFLCPELRTYLRMIRKTLGRGGFSVGAVIEDLFEVKAELRQGWGLSAGEVRIESVAEHMYGAFLLAWLYLPEKGSDGYSKEEILRLLLLHALNEAFTGDKNPDDLNNEDRTVATQWISYLSMLSTHKELPGLKSLHAEWSKFANGSGINVQIAREFDLLERLVQLYIYVKRHRLEASQHERWRSKIDNKVRSEHGRRVFGIITRHFGGTCEPLSKAVPP